jgi:hypothetical protein
LVYFQGKYHHYVMKPQRLMILACLGTVAVIGAVAFIGIKGQEPIIANGQSTYTATITPASLTNSAFDLRDDGSRGYIDFSGCTILEQEGVSYFSLPSDKAISTVMDGVDSIPSFMSMSFSGLSNVPTGTTITLTWGATLQDPSTLAFSEGTVYSSGTNKDGFNISFSNTVVFATMALTIACQA